MHMAFDTVAHTILVFFSVLILCFYILRNFMNVQLCHRPNMHNKYFGIFVTVFSLFYLNLILYFILISLHDRKIWSHNAPFDWFDICPKPEINQALWWYHSYVLVVLFYGHLACFSQLPVFSLFCFPPALSYYGYWLIYDELIIVFLSCKSLWIKVSAKLINVKVNVVHTCSSLSSLSLCI